MALDYQQALALARWFLSSPSLLAETSLAATNLEALDTRVTASALANKLIHSSSSSRLGVIFEALYQCYLACLAELSPNTISDAACRVQVTNAKGKTLGEFDCLYFDHQRQRPVHVELAVKFYLSVCQSAKQSQAMAHWIGPNKKDRLSLKVDKLLNQQLRLSDRPEGQATLASRQPPMENPEKRYLVKGRLFLPWAVASLKPEQQRQWLPQEVNKTCDLGYWLNIEQLPQLMAQFEGCHWILLERLQWMMTQEQLLDSTQERLINPTAEYFSNPKALTMALAERWRARPTPLQIAPLVSPATELSYYRYFVAPTSWSETT